MAYTASHLAMNILGIKESDHYGPSAVNERTAADRLPPGEGETDEEARQHLLKTDHRRKSVSVGIYPHISQITPP